ncbi:Ribonuclease DdI [Entamoeba marina]
MFLFCCPRFECIADCSHGSFSLCSSHNTQVSYDYALHVQTWVGNFCYKKCCDLPSTTMAIRTGFTMHGWWPEFNSGGYPSCCKTLMERISYNWPSLSKCQFVNYEYDKHGTCLSDVYDGATGPKDYMNAAMDFQNNYDIWQWFQDEGVVADGSTSFDKEFLRGIIEKNSGWKYLTEMRICTNVNKFDKTNPYFVQCSSSVLDDESCGSSIVFEKDPILTDAGCSY